MKIAVIGAGASGLAVLRQFTVDDKYDVICFEQLPEVGGLWIYSDVINDVTHPTGSQYTAVYKNLKTNLPHQIMAYTDFPFPKGLPSYIKHEDVKKYLQNYCDHFNLKQFIQFNTRVTCIKPQAVLGRDDVWFIKNENVFTKEMTEQLFDAVFICSGKFTKPIYPEIKGLNLFKGNLLHSQTYRDPQDYTNKRVLVIGGGPSGIDIASEICEFADKTWLSHRRNKLPISNKIEQIDEILYFTDTSAIYIDKGKFTTSETEKQEFDSSTANHNLISNHNSESNQSIKSLNNIDCVLCCTGFAFSYPFLSCDSGVAVVAPMHVGPLYKDLISASRPTLAFLGLIYKIVPFSLFECQSKFLKAHLDGRFKFPKAGKELSEELNKEMEAKKARGVDLLTEPHNIGESQWSYRKELASLGGFEPPPDFYEALHNQVRKQKKISFLDYKTKEYKVNEDGSFQEI